MKTIKNLILLSAILLFYSIGIFAQDEPKEMLVLYQIPGMEKAIIKKDITYTKSTDSTLKMDIYYPPNFDFKKKIPAVVFILGYTDSAQKKLMGQQLRKWSGFISWCKVIAASNMAAVVYETVDPENDIIALEKYIHTNQDKLMIDMNNLGAFSCSAHSITAISHILNAQSLIFKCAVSYYGIILTKNFQYLAQMDTISMGMGFKTPRLSDPENWNKNVPILIVRAGLDNVPHINEALSVFYEKAIEQNLPVTLINYPDGYHTFDYNNDNETTRMIIKNTLEFWKFYLHVK
jgi:hypothetical protein